MYPNRVNTQKPRIVRNFPLKGQFWVKKGSNCTKTVAFDLHLQNLYTLPCKLKVRNVLLRVQLTSSNLHSKSIAVSGHLVTHSDRSIAPPEQFYWDQYSPCFSGVMTSLSVWAVLFDIFFEIRCFALVKFLFGRGVSTDIFLVEGRSGHRRCFPVKIFEQTILRASPRQKRNLGFGYNEPVFTSPYASDFRWKWTLVSFVV